jgi:hypothetical protein
VFVVVVVVVVVVVGTQYVSSRDLF